MYNVENCDNYTELNILIIELRLIKRIICRKNSLHCWPRGAVAQVRIQVRPTILISPYRNLTEAHQDKTPTTRLKSTTNVMTWLLGPKSKLSLENNTLIYKCILKPIWSMEFNYGDVLNHQTPK
jgi:hypothetical protein